MKKISITIVFLFSLIMEGISQQKADAKGLMEIFTQLMEAYGKSEGLSYDIRYRYTNESTPAIVLDSLEGRVEMLDSTRYRIQLDSTETLVNTRYSIVLFKEDKVMQVSRPAANASMQPLTLIEQFLVQNKGITYQQKVSGTSKTVRLLFMESPVCKELTLTIDTRSGYLTQMVYVVPTQQLVDVTERSAFEANDGDYEPYARVEARFYNYRKSAADPARFEESRFFYKEGNQYYPAKAYNEYTIILGSPGL